MSVTFEFSRLAPIVSRKWAARQPQMMPIGITRRTGFAPEPDRDLRRTESSLEPIVGEGLTRQIPISPVLRNIRKIRHKTPQGVAFCRVHCCPSPKRGGGSWGHDKKDKPGQLLQFPIRGGRGPLLRRISGHEIELHALRNDCDAEGIRIACSAAWSLSGADVRSRRASACDMESPTARRHEECKEAYRKSRLG
jgi:hypothetical protein